MATDTMEHTGTTNIIAENTVLLAMHFGMPGNTRRISSTYIEVDADRDAVSAYKELLSGELLKRIATADTAFRDWVRNRSLPSKLLKAGMYRIPLVMLENIDAAIGRYTAERKVGVEDFMDRYGYLVEDARTRLRGLYNPLDYPLAAEMRIKFRVTFEYLAFDVPDTLDRVSSDILDRERAKAATSAQVEAEEIRQALREGFAELIEHAVDRLGSYTEGKKQGENRTFRNSLIERVSEFFETFNGRNVLGDDELGDMVERARELMSGIKPDTLRKNQDTRDRVKNGLAALKSEMTEKNMIGEAARGLSFDDER